jgi:hypothetical protein
VTVCEATRGGEKRERIRRRSSNNKFGEIDRRQGGDVIPRAI